MLVLFLDDDERAPISRASLELYLLFLLLLLFLLFLLLLLLLVSSILLRSSSSSSSSSSWSSFLVLILPREGEGEGEGEGDHEEGAATRGSDGSNRGHGHVDPMQELLSPVIIDSRGGFPAVSTAVLMVPSYPATAASAANMAACIASLADATAGATVLATPPLLCSVGVKRDDRSREKGEEEDDEDDDEPDDEPDEAGEGDDKHPESLT